MDLNEQVEKKVEQSTLVEVSKNKLTADQKFKALEQSIAELTGNFNKFSQETQTTFSKMVEDFNAQLKLINNQVTILAEEIDLLGQTMGKVDRKVTASIKAGEQGKLSQNSVEQIIIEEDVKELVGKLKFLEKQGAIVKKDDKITDERTFIVGKQVNQEGKETVPRLQFAIMTLSEEVKKYFMNKKLGDKVQMEGENDVVEIMEIYDIPDFKQEKTFVETPEDTGVKPVEKTIEQVEVKNCEENTNKS